LTLTQVKITGEGVRLEIKREGGNNLKLKVCSPTSETFERRGVDAGSRVDAERHPEVKVMKLFFHSSLTDTEKARAFVPGNLFSLIMDKF
jgi:hypothetical protein